MYRSQSKVYTGLYRDPNLRRATVNFFFRTSKGCLTFREMKTKADLKVNENKRSINYSNG